MTNRKPLYVLERSPAHCQAHLSYERKERLWGLCDAKNRAREEQYCLNNATSMSYLMEQTQKHQDSTSK